MKPVLPLLLLVLMPLTTNLAFGEETLPLWPPGKMPGEGAAAPESSTEEKGIIRVTNVSDPTIAVYRAAAGKNTPAILVCPGGGYHHLSINKAASDVAEWLATQGVTGIVLKYRVPGNRDGAFQDVQRAMQLIRGHAKEWNIDPNKVGVIGFSAGGHLSARLSTAFDQAAAPQIDEFSTQSRRPDFAILVYPAYLERKGVLAPELPISEKTPPTLLVHTEDDPKFLPGTKIYKAALDAARVPNEFLLYTTGGHGYGMKCDGEARVWPEQTKAWLQKIGVL